MGYNLDRHTMNLITINVQQGTLSGKREIDGFGEEYFAFRGIPYAKPPKGKLRFQDPEKINSWTGVLNATEYRDICAQLDSASNNVIGSDDCLHVHVFTRNINPATPLAVMVWIHGGGYKIGCGHDNQFGPDYLIEKNIVLVTINYRLGILGFLNLNDESASGNQGLKDQVMALQWVQENIRNFGGDPDNVTIFGQGAGASSVHYLTLSPLAEGLFHKAILQSGVATCPWAFTTDSMLDAAVKISVALGNEVTEVTDTKKLIEFLQTVDGIKLVTETTKLCESWKNTFLDINPFLPSVDSKSKNPFLDVALKKAVKRGIKVPFIIGYNNNEGIIYLRELTDERYAEIDADPENLLVNPKMNNFLKEHNLSVAQIKKVFMQSKPISRENGALLAKLRSATDFFIHIHQVLEIQPSKIPMYMYKFIHNCKETAVVQALYKLDIEGTGHGEDMFYLFHGRFYDTLGIPLPQSRATERGISQFFVNSWTNFAKTGDPNSEESVMNNVKWRPCTKVYKLDKSNPNPALHEKLQAYKYLEIDTNISMADEFDCLVHTSQTNIFDDFAFH